MPIKKKNKIIKLEPDSSSSFVPSKVFDRNIGHYEIVLKRYATGYYGLEIGCTIIELPISKFQFDEMLSARGCSSKCAICLKRYKKYFNAAYKELIRLVETYGVRVIVGNAKYKNWKPNKETIKMLTGK